MPFQAIPLAMHKNTGSPLSKLLLIYLTSISELPPKCGDDQIDVMVRRQRYHCPTCGAHDDDVSSWHVDHIIPRSRGGADVEANCQAICATCNSRKGARVHWVDFLGGRNRG